MHFNLIELIKTVGLLGVWGIVFAESGLFFGFFLPGDSLLFTAGFLAAQNFINIYALVVGSTLAAIAGDNVGYTFGRKIGPKIFNRPNSRFFKHEHLDRAHAFYVKHGAKTIILARFMPFVRTFAPIVAGAAQMHYKTFFVNNIIGGLLWGAGLPLAGYALGNIIPNVDKYLLPIVALIILVSIAPGIYHYLNSRRLHSGG